MKRIFIAIPISEELRQRELEWKNSRDGLLNFPIRWIDGKNLHLTLVPPWRENDIEAAKQKLDSAAGSGVFEIEFVKISYGPNLKHRRLIWAEGKPSGKLDILYDVAHNIAKMENYKINGKEKTVVMHRKGATRAFPNQPVIIPGSMGTGSYLLVGQEKALEESFGSSCHGAGRRMSRHQAKKEVRGSELKQELENEGIAVAAGSMSGIAEEAPLAYKDVDEVVDVVHNAGIAKKVARMRPLAVVKG